jgi:hypothetical protein
MTRNDLQELLALCLRASPEFLAVGYVDKGSHEANAEFIRECLAYLPSTRVSVVLTEGYEAETGKVLAFTGNGERGEANALLFGAARNAILALIRHYAPGLFDEFMGIWKAEHRELKGGDQ